jgi:Trypsin
LVGREAAPQVVLFQTSLGNCTATKVGPRVFLTAHHCIDKAARQATLEQDDKSYAVIVEGFASAPPSVTKSVYDFAFVFLDRDTPSIPAAPVRVAVGAPLERQRALGFGCSDELREYNLDPASQGEFEAYARAVGVKEPGRHEDAPITVFRGDKACDGDSGGPILNAGGEIIGLVFGGNETLGWEDQAIGLKWDAPLNDLFAAFRASPEFLGVEFRDDGKTGRSHRWARRRNNRHLGRVVGIPCRPDCGPHEGQVIRSAEPGGLSCSFRTASSSQLPVILARPPAPAQNGHERAASGQRLDKLTNAMTHGLKGLKEGAFEQSLQPVWRLLS